MKDLMKQIMNDIESSDKAPSDIMMLCTCGWYGSANLLIKVKDNYHCPKCNLIKT